MYLENLQVTTERRLQSFAQTMSENLKSSFPRDYKTPNYGKGRVQSLSPVERMALCKGVTSMVETPGCASALGKLMPKLEVVVSGASVLDPELQQKTIADQKITRALQNVATSLWDKIGARSFTGSDNIYDDLLKELHKEGFSGEEAKDKALQIMGALSTGGPNFSLRGPVSDLESFPQCPNSCNPNYVFLSAIAEGLVHADTLKMNSSSKLYSLPSNVDFPCDSGKGYHFWMSAYYANQLTKEGVQAQSAQSAVYVSHLGYHIARREQRDENGDNNLLSMGRFTSPENGVRMDLVLASSGARFGAEGANTSAKISVREAYIETLKAGNADTSQEDWRTPADPRKYYKWLDRVGARTALESFK